MPVFFICPVLPSPSFSWHAPAGSAGRCLCDAAVTTPSRFSGVDRPPWHREAAARNPAPMHSWDDCAGARHHRPYSRRVTERMECNVVTHPSPSIYPKAGNGALRDQWAIKYNCQNDSSTIAFTVRDLVHWNYVISQNIPRVSKSWKSLSIYVFAACIFFCSPDTQST